MYVGKKLNIKKKCTCACVADLHRKFSGASLPDQPKFLQCHGIFLGGGYWQNTGLVPPPGVGAGLPVCVSLISNTIKMNVTKIGMKPNDRLQNEA